MTRRGVYAAWAASRSVMVAMLLLPKVGKGKLFGDVDRYYEVARTIVDWSAVPYRDFAWEYPPGAVAVIAPPAFFGVIYPAVFVLFMLLADFAVLRVLLAMGERLGSRNGTWLWVVGLLLMGPIAFTRFDTAVALLAALALASIAAGAPAVAGVALGGGIAMKLWPALLLVVVPLVEQRRRLLVATAATLAATAVAVVAIGGSRYATDTFTYHADRGLQVESIVATPVVVAQRAGAAVDISFYESSGSWDVTGTGTEGALAVSSVATLLALAVIAALVWRLRRSPEAYADLAATTLLLLTVTGKVLSPQYVIWLLAVFGAALCRRGSPLFVPSALIAGTAVLGQWVYPAYYSDLVNGGGTTVVVALAVRNAALVVATVLAVRALWRTATP